MVRSVRKAHGVALCCSRCFPPSPVQVPLALSLHHAPSAPGTALSTTARSRLISATANPLPASSSAPSLVSSSATTRRQEGSRHWRPLPRAALRRTPAARAHIGPIPPPSDPSSRSPPSSGSSSRSRSDISRWSEAEALACPWPPSLPGREAERAADGRCSGGRWVASGDSAASEGELIPSLTRGWVEATEVGVAGEAGRPGVGVASSRPSSSNPSSSSSSDAGGGGGSVLGAVALITGTSVGAGVLALPSETAPAGFMPSVVVLGLCWAFLTLEAFLLADVNVRLMGQRRERHQQQQKRKKQADCGVDGGPSEPDEASDVISLRTMAEETLGPVGGWCSTATYVFLSYTLLVAYVAKAADVLGFGAAADIPAPVLAGAFSALLGGAVYAGTTESTDWLNRIMTAGLLALFGATVFGGAMTADWSELAVHDWTEAPAMVPVVFLSLVFHDLIPVLCTYLGGDLGRIRKAITLGSAVPLAMFLTWDAVALALCHGCATAAPGTYIDPLQAIIQSGGSTQFAVIQSFSLLAVATSFIGTALSMSEFFIEQLGRLSPFRSTSQSSLSQAPPQTAPATSSLPQCSDREQEQRRPRLSSPRERLRAAAFLLVLVPPVALSSSIPDAFFSASEAAGAYGMTVLYGIFPPLMFWRMHQAEEEKQRTSAHAEAVTPPAAAPEPARSSESWVAPFRPSIRWTSPVGSMALASMGACAFAVMLSQAIIDSSALPSDMNPNVRPSSLTLATTAATVPVSFSDLPEAPTSLPDASLSAPPLSDVQLMSPLAPLPAA